jgi:hypothetical protein
MEFWRFYLPVLRRVPGVFMSVAGIVGALVLIIAAVFLLVFSRRVWRNDWRKSGRGC